jgi:hypothetical protein
MWVIDVSFKLNEVVGHEIVATVKCGFDAYLAARAEFARRAREAGCWNVVDVVCEGTIEIVDNVPTDILYTPIMKGCGCGDSELRT